MLKFYYGVMGSSKTANALMTRHNYITNGMNVLLIKPSADTRDFSDGKIVVRTRIGLEAECTPIEEVTNLIDLFNNQNKIKPVDVIILDEAQMITPSQVEQLKQISLKVPVLCYGLKNNFKTELFAASKRLLELADRLSEIISVCSCGKKATMNVRYVNGVATTTGAELAIEGQNNITYDTKCYKCFLNEIKKD